jgi:CrcB protein
VNVTGALALGFVFALFTERIEVAPWVRSTIAIGFLGGYTTFSTFAQEGLDLMREGQSAVALLYAVGSVLVGLVAVYAGMAVGRVL